MRPGCAATYAREPRSPTLAKSATCSGVPWAAPRRRRARTGSRARRRAGPGTASRGRPPGRRRCPPRRCWLRRIRRGRPGRRSGRPRRCPARDLGGCRRCCAGPGPGPSRSGRPEEGAGAALPGGAAPPTRPVAGRTGAAARRAPRPAARRSGQRARRAAGEGGPSPAMPRRGSQRSRALRASRRARRGRGGG